MAPRSDYVTGTITLTNGLSTFTGAGTAWALAGFREGDEIKQVAGQTQWEAMVATITSNTTGTLVRPWGGATGTYAYRMRFQPDGSRVTAQARELIELLGDGTLLSLAGLVGPGVIELLPGGGAQVVPKTDLVSGANYDVQVANLAARTAYDGQAAGFSVLVADVGDGRAAIYSKITNASGNWSPAAYVTGPTGPVSTVPGVVWRGTYAAGTTYAVNDGVTFNGSSFRKLTTAAAGTAPYGANPPVNTAAWEVLAAKGQDGTGTGTLTSVVAGPGISVNNSNPAAPVVSALGSSMDFHKVVASETTTSTVFADLATVGPVVTIDVPASGLLRLDIRSRLSQATAAFFAFAGYALSGANTLAASDDESIGLQQTSSPGQAAQIGATFMLSGLNPGITTVTMKYRASGGTATFARRQLIATAIRD